MSGNSLKLELCVSVCVCVYAWSEFDLMNWTVSHLRLENVPSGRRIPHNVLSKFKAICEDRFDGVGNVCQYPPLCHSTPRSVCVCIHVSGSCL